jgi:tRNA/tmRNA/rRNA uracil-C5-methylase (TrmA/RlmC/RlmD family)
MHDSTMIGPAALPPGCEPTCHGCRHRTFTLEASLAQKREYLSRILARWQDRLEAVASVASCDRLGYRDRVTLTARWQPQAGWRFGLVRRDELIAIHDCPVHTSRVRALVHGLVGSLPPPDAFPLAYLHVAGAQATLIVKARSIDPDLLQGLRDAIGTTGIEGLWLHCHPSAGRRLFARSGWRLLWGRARSSDSTGLEHGPTGFQQLLPTLHERALDEAEAHLSPRAGDAVLDLYCGIGATLRRWTARGASALGVELSGEAIESAGVNAPSAQLLRGTCVHRLPQIAEWWQGQSGTRHAFVNPPRSGLEAEVLGALAARLVPARLAYLSCSAGTLARDLQALGSAGYEVDRLLPFDFFPLTHHVEVLALLTRRRLSQCPA